MPEASDSSIEDILMRRRAVSLGDITHEGVTEVVERILRLQEQSQERITLLIESSGGDSFAAFRLCELITHFLTVPVRGVVVHGCASAATFVLMHCDERICTPFAQFLIHSGTTSGIEIPVGRRTPEVLKDLLAESQAVEERVTQLYMRRLDLKRKQVKKLMARGDQEFDRYFSAEEALEIGLVQEIVKGKLDIFG